uniref:Uncharacterized protein n=1 Tax=Lactuca sativa TaxID=4236 RepID=A0A9R1XR76_LACSA|nr:hypothetical protein LSAT_V11C300154750 [Lactuca sativa]
MELMTFGTVMFYGLAMVAFGILSMWQQLLINKVVGYDIIFMKNVLNSPGYLYNYQAQAFYNLTYVQQQERSQRLLNEKRNLFKSTFNGLKFLKRRLSNMIEAREIIAVLDVDVLLYSFPRNDPALRLQVSQMQVHHQKMLYLKRLAESMIKQPL